MKHGTSPQKVRRHGAVTAPIGPPLSSKPYSLPFTLKSYFPYRRKVGWRLMEPDCEGGQGFIGELFNVHSGAIFQHPYRLGAAPNKKQALILSCAKASQERREALLRKHQSYRPEAFCRSCTEFKAPWTLPKMHQGKSVSWARNDAAENECLTELVKKTPPKQKPHKELSFP